MTEPCEICRKAALAQQGKNPLLIREFEHSFLVVGDHQFFPGYSVLLAKVHAREPFELPPAVQRELFSELMTSARAIQAAFRPWKMNYACYGNQVPHVHWHLFPRYESDPEHQQVPWVHAAEFAKHPTGAERALEVATRIREELAKAR